MTDYTIDPDQMTDETLTSLVEVLSSFEREDELTEFQDRKLRAARQELTARAMVAGPDADYTGPEGDDD